RLRKALRIARREAPHGPQRSNAFLVNTHELRKALKELVQVAGVLAGDRDLNVDGLALRDRRRGGCGAHHQNGQERGAQEHRDKPSSPPEQDPAEALTRQQEYGERVLNLVRAAWAKCREALKIPALGPWGLPSQALAETGGFEPPIRLFNRITV